MSLSHCILASMFPLSIPSISLSSSSDRPDRFVGGRGKLWGINMGNAGINEGMFGMAEDAGKVKAAPVGELEDVAADDGDAVAPAAGDGVVAPGVGCDVV